MVTTLGGFENLKLNQIADAAYGISGDKIAGVGGLASAGKFTYRMLMAAMIPAVLGAYVSGNGPKDDENPGLWAAKRSLFFAGGMLPFLKDGASLIDHGSLNPVVSYLERSMETYKNATSGKRNVDRTALGIDALEFTGDLAGVPGTAQAAHMARYVKKANEGKIQNPSVYGAVVAGH